MSSDQTINQFPCIFKIRTTIKFNLKTVAKGAPAWLSRLSTWLLILVQVMFSWVVRPSPTSGSMLCRESAWTFSPSAPPQGSLFPHQIKLWRKITKNAHNKPVAKNNRKIKIIQQMNARQWLDKVHVVWFLK